MTDALTICRANTASAVAAKAALRDQFPLCAEIIGWLQKVGFEPRVMRMDEGNGKLWERGSR